MLAAGNPSSCHPRKRLLAAHSKESSNLAFLFLLAPGFASAQLESAGARCAVALTETGRNRLLQVSQEDRQAYFYRKVCGSQGEDAALNFGIAKVALGFSYGSKEEYCTSEQSRSGTHKIDFLQTSTVVESALAAWLECIRLTNAGLEVKPQVVGPRITIDLTKLRTALGRIRGVDATNGTVCRARVGKKDVSLDRNLDYQLPVQETWSITCNRKSSQSALTDGELVYPETVITVDTSEGVFNLGLAAEPLATERWASNIDARLNDLTRSADQRLHAVETQLAEGNFTTNTLVAGTLKAQKFGRSGCQLIDSSTDRGDLWCPDGYYVAGAQNYSRASHVLDIIWCCKPQ